MSNSYWERRQVQNMYEYIEEAEKAADQISTLYLKASRYMSLHADEIFERYQIKHKLSRNEAMQLLNTLQDRASLDELMQKLKSGDGDKKDLLAQLESPAYQARLERLQQLQNQLDFVMMSVYEQEKKISTSHYVDLANEAYYHTIYDTQQRAQAAFSFNVVDAKTIDQVINSKWSGKNYSERIWGNTQALAQNLKEELLINLVTGRTNREAAEIIANKFAQGSSKARRLVWTESNYVSTELNFKAYEEAEIERYRYLATLDLKTSEICRELDGKIFPVKDRKTGTNCPPMHPWCRSTTISVISDELLNKLKRKARDPVTGKVIEVPMTMTYRQWYDQYVKGRPEAELEEKKIKNRSADRIQYQQYKKVLGENIPKTLDGFQDMKYNDPEKWNEIKEAYRDVNWQRKALENRHDSGDERKVPYQYEPNSVYDKMENGKVVQRRYFGKTGKPRMDIDMTNHGNPKEHKIVPHYHNWNEIKDGKMVRDTNHNNPLKLGHKIANADLVKE